MWELVVLGKTHAEPAAMARELMTTTRELRLSALTGTLTTPAESMIRNSFSLHTVSLSYTTAAVQDGGARAGNGI